VPAAEFAAAYTTVTNWWGGWELFRGESFPNAKRDGFLPFLDLPRYAPVPLELALSHVGSDLPVLRSRGWRVSDAHDVAGTPWDYQRFIQASRGEFSCAKPAYPRLQTAWISDRTLCYLASGKPAVVEHTGASRFLPDAAGLFRFRTLDEAVRCLQTVADDYERQSGLARALAEEFFDARKVLGRVLDRALR